MPASFKYPKISGISAREHFAQIIFLLSVVSCLSLVIFTDLREYLGSQWFNIALGCITMPFVIRIREDKKGSLRFAGAALIFITLSFIAPVHTFIYFALVSIIFFIVESRYGRINMLAVVVVFLASPIFEYIGNTFSFPIRMWLTAVCGHVFQSMGSDVEVAGNTINYSNSEFTVDPACMGLSMLTTSFLISLLLLGFFQKKYNRALPFRMVALYMGIIFLLNILSNLVRMFLLVLFFVLPDTIMHEAIGLICFSVQVVLPGWAICWYLVHKSKNKPEEETGPQVLLRSFPVRTSLVLISLCAGIWISTLHKGNVSILEKNPVSSSLAIPGYQTVPYAKDLVKLENDTALVYVKNIRWFCDSDHNPMICWKGSGYNITQARETRLGELTIYTGILQNNDDVLYTAWWYSNGQTVTNSQLHWRWDMLKGEPAYSLINVTTATPQELMSEVERFTHISRL